VLASTMRSDFIGTYECKNLRVKLKIFEFHISPTHQRC
jgi:hypothetical protein